jgi:hypothetical protein
MQSETMIGVMGQVEVLTASLSADEKLAIAAVLAAQAKQGGVNGNASNGLSMQKDAPDKAAPNRQRELEWLKQHDNTSRCRAISW